MKLKTALSLTILLLAWNLNVASARMDNALIGPLFYTPPERDAIDRGNLVVDSESGVEVGNAPPQVLRFDGRVERSAGRTTAWVSGRPLERVQPALPDARLRLRGDRLQVETPETTRWLKAGEQFEPDQSTVPEPTQDRPGALDDMGAAQ